MGWRVETDHVNHETEGIAGVIKLFIHGFSLGDGQSQSASWSHSQVKAEPVLGATCGGEAEVLSGALNMEAQLGLRKGQYSSPPQVCVRILYLPPLSLSHTQLVSVADLSRNKKRRTFFLRKCQASTSCLYAIHQFEFWRPREDPLSLR